MTTEYWILLAAILVLVALSAFFSGSETALTAVTRARMHRLEKNGDNRAATVTRLIDKRDRLIGALLIGNNLVNILASVLATSMFLELFGDSGIALATIAMTIVIVIFAEITPKSWAISGADRFALAVAPFVSAVVFVLAPLANLMSVVVRFILRLIGIRLDADQSMLSAHEELRGAVEVLHREGSVVKDERDRLGGLLDLGDLDVSDVMVHRTRMHTIDADEPAEKIVEDILSSPYTRVPLWEGEPENIIGIVHAKELLRALKAVGGDFSAVDVRAIAAKPWFVPDATSATDQLNAFLKRKVHFALVVDEYGEVQGLLTLEDILEEIVGDIADEHDVAVTGVKPLAGGGVSVDGTVPIRDLNRAMDWELPDEEATTIAGLVIHEARQIPEKGQVFNFHGFRFAVEGRERNRITKLRITPQERKPKGDAAPDA